MYENIPYKELTGAAQEIVLQSYLGKFNRKVPVQQAIAELESSDPVVYVFDDLSLGLYHVRELSRLNNLLDYEKNNKNEISN